MLPLHTQASKRRGDRQGTERSAARLERIPNGRNRKGISRRRRNVIQAGRWAEAGRGWDDLTRKTCVVGLWRPLKGTFAQRGGTAVCGERKLRDQTAPALAAHGIGGARPEG
jgi:hypothetical protein